MASLIGRIGLALAAFAVAGDALATPSSGVDRRTPAARVALAGLRDLPPFYPAPAPCRGRFDSIFDDAAASRFAALGIRANLNCR